MTEKNYPIKITEKPLFSEEVLIFDAQLWSKLTGSFTVKLTNLSSVLYASMLHTLAILRGNGYETNISDAVLLAILAYNDIDDGGLIDSYAEYFHVKESILHPLERKVVIMNYISLLDPEFVVQTQAVLRTCSTTTTTT